MYGVERGGGGRYGGLWGGAGGGATLTEHVHVLPNLTKIILYNRFYTLIIMRIIIQTIYKQIPNMLFKT